MLTLERIRSASIGEWLVVLSVSLAFPLFSTFYILLRDWRKRGHPEIGLAWMMYGVSIIFRLFFAETGPRAAQNNFAFCNFIASYSLFVVLIMDLYSLTKRVKGISLTIPWGLLGMHVFSGVWYFVLIAGEINTFF